MARHRNAGALRPTAAAGHQRSLSFVRNPMYVGLGVVLLGEGLTFPRLTITMLIVIACLWCATTLFILGFEEPVLREKFGDDYIDYCKQVRRWIPRVTPIPPVRQSRPE